MQENERTKPWHKFPSFVLHFFFSFIFFLSFFSCCKPKMLLGDRGKGERAGNKTKDIQTFKKRCGFFVIA